MNNRRTIIGMTMAVVSSCSILVGAQEGLDSGLMVELNSQEAMISYYGKSTLDLEPVSLLDIGDPRSTSLSLSIDGEIVRPSTNDWIVEASVIGSRNRIIWSRGTLSVMYSAYPDPNGSHAHLTFNVENRGETGRDIGLEILFDTILGEDLGVHFILPESLFIQKERSFSSEEVPDWIISRRDRNNPSLVLALRSEGVDTPDSIVLGNWLRLWESPLVYSGTEGRSFDALPFFPSDSAVALRYEPRVIESGESESFHLVLGLNTTFPTAGRVPESMVESVERSQEAYRLRLYTIRQRLSEIDVLISGINALFEDEENLTSENVVNIAEQTTRLEQLRMDYENL